MVRTVCWWLIKSYLSRHCNLAYQSLVWIAEASIFEDPGAGKLYAGICAGAVG
jgi:hypothetical protein